MELKRLKIDYDGNLFTLEGRHFLGVMKKEGYNISKFYRDGVYDNYSMFNILGKIGADKAIKIREMRQWVITTTKEKNFLGQ